MQKICLMLILLPTLNFASSNGTKKEIVRQGVVALIDWKQQELARDIKSKYHMEDVEWLNLALGKKVDPRTPMLYVSITDAGSRKYWHHHMNFKHPHDPSKEIFFPRWLPRSWFLRPQNGLVKPPRLFGAWYELIYVPRTAIPPAIKPAAQCEDREEGEIIDE